MAKKKTKGKSPRPKHIDLTPSEMQAFLDRVKGRSLADEDYGIIVAMTETIQCLSQALEEKATSIKRLLGYLFGASTESSKNVLSENEGNNQSPASSHNPRSEKKSRPKGHGRNGASSYTGGEHIIVSHPDLKSGDPCPACEKGKVYELALPSMVVRVVGSAPLKATVYELNRLRCNLCGMIFTAPAPDGVCNGKYDDSAAAMVALLKYGCGMPFYRMGKLQANMGMPVPPSTQWDLLDAAEAIVSPAFEALLRLAAQGKLLHNDDTTARILSEIQKQDPESARKGIFTTGVISVHEDHKIALFMTGHNHAGENMKKVLKQRASGLAPPQQMCDGAKRNIPENFLTILINCMAHARRQFVDIVEAFPEECRYVIELLAKVYHHDDVAKGQGLGPEPRMEFHRKTSGPLMEELETWCREQLAQKKVEPNSGLGKAINYMLNRWPELTRFLNIPGAPLDNNICERALKLAVLHRKNCYFFKTLRGAHVGDVFMSLIHTCQLAGENPFQYLTALLNNGAGVAKAPEHWLPWNYRNTLPSRM
jgi:transposase